MSESYIITVRFGSKLPHKTNWLEIEYPAEHKPGGLLDDLECIGWKQSGFPPPATLNGKQTIWVSRQGSDTFTEWKPAERQKFMRECRAVLQQHGFNNVPYHKFTMAEML